MCNDKQGIDLYPATSAIKKKRASPLPSTSHTMPMLFGKCKCQVKLWWATCSDAPPCFHPTPPFFRYQHFGSTRPVGKKDAGLLSSSPGQCVSSAFAELEGNHSRPPGADSWPAIRQLSRLAILWHPFYILHPSAHSLGTSTFGSTKPFGKKDAGLQSSSPGQCVSKCFWSLKATILEPQVLTDGQL